MTIILIAETMADGMAWLEIQPVPPNLVVIVTPRSPHGSRGVTAHAIFATPRAARHPRFDDVLAEAMPATAAIR